MNTLRKRTVKLVKRFITPLTDEGLITVAEEKIIFTNLKHLADKGELKPVIIPKLINQKEAAEMLGIGHSNFKKLEAENKFPFKRKMVVSAVRYRNTDIIDFIMSNED